ncbi:hypothetical protein DPX39_010046100 [Trypanosoma brucei equiperdum]|uniref:Uncharacterized protein n=1 Tax=Trypanosoma brucei equiperdum TaxID=630700 RepID=A0A3L6LCP4_9TRYP|nr:hypothetical protein DPX39_010046100 [Trypanosoma brucei equiperdum]
MFYDHVVSVLVIQFLSFSSLFLSYFRDALRKYPHSEITMRIVHTKKNNNI